MRSQLPIVVRGRISLPTYHNTPAYCALITYIQSHSHFTCIGFALASAYLRIPLGTIHGRMAELVNIGALRPSIDITRRVVRHTHHPRLLVQQNPSLEGYNFWSAEKITDPNALPPLRCRKVVHEQGPKWATMMLEWAAFLRSP